MKVLLLQLDGKHYNVALMRIAAHHRALGDEVEYRFGKKHVERGLFDDAEKVYASLIFRKSRPSAERLLVNRPDAFVGGTGWDLTTTLESIGITTKEQDYSIYPKDARRPRETRDKRSFGFTQRGCRLSCKFCVVPAKEGKLQPWQTVNEIWRGDPYPRHIVLHDNDFFGPDDETWSWRDRIAELQAGNFKVSFNQGINVRMITEETAAAIASVKYYDDDFTRRCIYTAWDNRRDEKILFNGLQMLVNAGVRRRHIMVYMLIGYWPGETVSDWQYRRARLREFEVLPYPMTYQRTPETLGFQRWVVNGYDRRGVSWEEFFRANYQPRNIGFSKNDPYLFEEHAQ